MFACGVGLILAGLHEVENKVLINIISVKDILRIILTSIKIELNKRAGKSNQLVI